MYLLDFLIGGDGVNKIGLYIHIPFCKSKCPYCDFYSLRKGENDYENYTAAVISSLNEWAHKTDKKADTLYFGGGTPSLIGSKRISKIIRFAKDKFGCNGEITVECNPSCVDEDFFKEIADAGVNRISLGMQSAVDNERKKLGRIADTNAVEKAIDYARIAEIENISLDVMIGIPEQTEKSLAQTLDFCVSSGAKHISAYMLKLEEGTWFFDNAHKLNLPDDDLTADLYLKMVDFLKNNGFEHYEISNFAVSGFESRHNMKYWNCEEYLGIGPAAHSFLNRKRFYYPRDISFFEAGNEPVNDGDGGDLQEYLMLRLRLSKGIIFDKCRERFPSFSAEDYVSKTDFLEKSGLVIVDENSIRLTTAGFLLSNSVIEKIIY